MAGDEPSHNRATLEKSPGAMVTRKLWPIVFAIALGVVTLAWAHLHGVMVMNVAR